MEGRVKMVTLSGKRILLCKDHSLNASITIKVLEHEGISVVHANNGKSGLELFLNEPDGYFDAILMDISMPVMDGLDAARAIRASAKKDARTIPIIAMTAKDCSADRDNSLAAGMNAHFAKPVDPTNLYNILAALIKP